MKGFKQRRAFTIVEMVIVIAVIAVLATVMIPTVSGVINKANVSTDQQLAASINKQLAVWEADPNNGTIDSEEQLRKAFEAYYDAGFIDKLAPKSGEQGYHYWYNATDKQFLLAKFEDLTKDRYTGAEADLDLFSEVFLLSTDGSVVPLAATDAYKFERNSPRSLIVTTESGRQVNFYLMDVEGSEFVRNLNDLEKAESDDDYSDKKKKLLATEDVPAALIDKITDKLSKTAIANDHGVFYEIPEAGGTLEFVHVPVEATKIGSSTAITDAKDAGVEVKVTEVNLRNVETVSFDSLLLGENVTVYVNSTKAPQDIFDAGSTDCKIVVPNGTEYVIKVNDEGESKLINAKTQEEVATLTVKSINALSFVYEDATPNQGEDDDYFFKDTKNTEDPKDDTYNLYLAYDFDSAQLKLGDGVEYNQVNWTVTTKDAPITVSDNGKITLAPGTTPNAQNATASVTASLKADKQKAVTINVHLVFPKTVNWKFIDVLQVAPVVNNNLEINYTGKEKTFALEFVNATLSQDGFVKMNEESAYSFKLSEGTLLTLKDNVLTLDDTKFKDAPAQTLTVSYGTATHTYVSQTYAINVKDNSAVPFAVNNITDDVKMGATYLLRVGNGNSIKLGQFFNCAKASNVIALNIYDASKSAGENKWDNIATSGSGFSATYTSALTKDTWADSTIKFTGTGVAIIEIKTEKGTATLAVEVVNGKNVFEGEQLTGSSDGNYVMLGNVTLTSGGTFSLGSGKTVYGNGYTYDVSKGANNKLGIITLSGGTLDNVTVVGPVYTGVTLTSFSDNSSNTIFASGGAVITNSYVSNGMASVRTNGDLTIVDSTIDGGRYANVVHQNGTLTLNNVTTIGMAKNNVLGFGIVVTLEANDETNIIIENGITQYNWIGKKKDGDLFTGDLSKVFDLVFSNDTKSLQIEYEGDTYVNGGIVWLNNNPIITGLPNIYGNATVSSSMGASGHVHSVKNSYALSASDLIDPGYTPDQQGALVPNFTSNFPSTYDSTLKKVNLSYEQGSSVSFNPVGIWTAKKYNESLIVNIKMNDQAYTGPITFNAPGDYVIVYEVEDDKVYNQNGVATDDKIYFKKELKVTVTETIPEIPEPTFKFFDIDGTEYSAKLEKISDTKYYVMPNVSAVSDGKIGSKTVSGKTVYFPIIESEWKTGGLLDSDSVYRYYPLFKGINITKWTSPTASVTYNTSYEGMDGVTWVSGGNTGGNGFSGYEKNSSYGGYCRVTNSIKASGTNGKTLAVAGESNVVEFTFECNGVTYVYYIGYEIIAESSGGSSGGDSGGCVTPDTLVTLADGTQVRVDSLTGDELLLVWNMETGMLDSAPIMFVDREKAEETEVIRLIFSDGTDVEVVYEHGFWDYDLNKYVYLDENAADYVGHWFAKQNGDALEKVQLVDVVIETEITEAWSPVTQGHLCYFVNGMLSMPGGVGGLFNIFDVDAETMTYDYEALARDIETYGLFTYEEMNAIVPLSEDMYNMAGGAYLKISIGKGNMTMDDLAYMINRYSIYFN